MNSNGYMYVVNQLVNSTEYKQKYGTLLVPGAPGSSCGGIAASSMGTGSTLTTVQIATTSGGNTSNEHSICSKLFY